jgi:hypothetical protein
VIRHLVRIITHLDYSFIDDHLKELITIRKEEVTGFDSP